MCNELKKEMTKVCVVDSAKQYKQRIFTICTFMKHETLQETETDEREHTGQAFIRNPCR